MSIRFPDIPILGADPYRKVNRRSERERVGLFRIGPPIVAGVLKGRLQSGCILLVTNQAR